MRDSCASGPARTRGRGLSLLLLALTLPAGAATFVDPTAERINPDFISLGDEVYVAPFATLRAGGLLAPIVIGPRSNVQDSVEVDASRGAVLIGEQVILAHGATVRSRSNIGLRGRCPLRTQAACPSFVGFNAVVDGATIEKDAMVQTLARVAPGVTIPSGRKVQPGRNVASNAEVAAKTDPVTEADREFMAGVIAVNREFAEGYEKMVLLKGEETVRGIGPDPGLLGAGSLVLNEPFTLPTLAGVATQEPAFRNRIIGDVQLADPLATLDLRMGAQISLRADEGTPFIVGPLKMMASRSTFHALEGSSIKAGGSGASYGFHSVVHGGPAPADPTTTGAQMQLGDWSVLFRSAVGDNVTIGFRSLVQASSLPDGFVVPPCTIYVSNAVVRRVEWCGLNP